jgi:cytochrome c biogenesis protein CcdA
MANQSAKKIVKANKEMLSRAVLMIAGFLVCILCGVSAVILAHFFDFFPYKTLTVVSVGPLHWNQIHLVV